LGRPPTRLNGSAVQASDEALAAQAAALGDAESFELLMRRHERRIHYLLLRFTRDPALAEDLCQETFLRAWRKLSTFQGSGSFAGWLARLAHNVFLADRRLARTARETVTDDPDRDGPAAATVAGNDEAPDLDRLLAVVSPQEQRLLTLSYAAGLSATEIGAMLGESPGTVKAKIHRAKQKIRHHFAIGDPS
jgi:RNA polymerase sigma-70 factor, ECF subfamily